MAALAPPPASEASLPSVVRKKLGGFVGFAHLPNQYHRRSVRKGFQFTAMVVGESGLGKSTLVNTLFNTTLYAKKAVPRPEHDRPQTVAIESLTADIEENGVRLRLTVVDTPGYGELINNADGWKPILDNIEARFDAFLEHENRVHRPSPPVDPRIHACLYFLEPTGHALKPLDLEFMRRLHTRVNLIPVIAKADTLTEDELAGFKARILADLAHHRIEIYQAPHYDGEDDETLAEHEEIVRKIPFAVVGADPALASTPNARRGRSYPWGTVEVDNEDHCDFVKLRQMLVRTHMEELKEHTHHVLYENYRAEKLLAMGVAQDHSVFKEVNPAAKMAEERALHEAKLAKMETEMRLVFQQKVNEKEAKLKQSEEELYARHREMKDALEKQRLELEEKKRRLEQGRPLTPTEKVHPSTKKKGFLRA